MRYDPLAQTLGGMKIITDPYMTDPMEDWSGVRSPARARRRRRKHRQNIKIVRVPKPDFFVMGDRIICHPEMARKLIAKADLI